MIGRLTRPNEGSIKIECQEIGQSLSPMHKPCQDKTAKNCHHETSFGGSERRQK